MNSDELLAELSRLKAEKADREHKAAQVREKHAMAKARLDVLREEISALIPEESRDDPDLYLGFLEQEASDTLALARQAFTE